MTNADIWKKVEELRASFDTLEVGNLPLDLISFVELDLRLDLIPYDGLRQDFGADAAILSDFSGFYIDGEIFDRIDMIRGSQLNRLRFSIAHELGHLFLHREHFESAGIVTTDHLLSWLNEHEGRKYDFEREANEFAGRLLVPVDVLRECFDRLRPVMDDQYGKHVWVTNTEIRSKTAEVIAPRFGVHPIAIETRFDREGIWPSPFQSALWPINPKGIDWVIVGGESGANPRPMKPEWAISIRDQCEAGDVAFFFKQWGGRNKKAAGRQLEGSFHDGLPKPKKRPARGKKARFQASC